MFPKQKNNSDYGNLDFKKVLFVLETYSTTEFKYVKTKVTLKKTSLTALTSR